MNTKIFSKWWFWVIAVIVFLGLMSALFGEDEATSAVGENTTNAELTKLDEQASMGSKGNPYVLDADIWFAEHCEGKTQEKYIDKWVKVRGTVLTISKQSRLNGYYLAGGQNSGLVCWVADNELDVQCGQCIEYVGIVTVEDPGHIAIFDGHIESAKWPDLKPKSPITISEWTWNKNYVGGVEWNFKFTNNTDKTIKYIIMEWDCYNAVGDLVYDEITGKSSHNIKYTGPLDAAQTTDLLRNTSLFYNHSYNSAKLTKLQVELMDGTIIRVTNNGYADIIASE